MTVTAFLWVSIVLVFCLFALLVLPVTLVARGSADDREGFGYDLAVTWGFGIFSLRAGYGRPAGVYLWDLRLRRLEGPWGGRKKAARGAGKKKRPPSSRIRWVRDNMGLFMDLIGKGIRVCFVRGSLTGRIGLHDPADTARIGLFCDLLQRIPMKHFTLSVSRVYDDERVNVRGQVQATLIMGYLGLVAIGLLFQKEFRAMIRSLPRARMEEV